jgi:hypothetical protein
LEVWELAAMVTVVWEAVAGVGWDGTEEVALGAVELVVEEVGTAVMALAVEKETAGQVDSGAGWATSVVVTEAAHWVAKVAAGVAVRKEVADFVATVAAEKETADFGALE